MWRDWLTQDEESLQGQNPHGRIIVSTQVVEAGVDISARTLITELAPWPSLVQRFGRCNRRGEFGDGKPAQVFWVNVPTPDEKKAAPYSKDELDAARERLRTLDDVGLKSLAAFFDGLTQSEREQLFPFDPPHVIRRKDFIDLFDTTPDLAGNDIDVSRFIRDGDDIDVQVFWRNSPPPERQLAAKVAKRLAPARWELCSVKIGDFRAFVAKVKKAGKTRTPAYRWDALDGRWAPADPDVIFPGQVFWLPASVGGYSKELGWEPDAPSLAEDECRQPTDVERLTEGEAKDDDLASQSHAWQSIAEHTAEVAKFLGDVLDALGFQELPRKALEVAARWHDWGKAHEVFQNRIKDDLGPGFQRPSGFAGRRDIAKAEGRFWGRSYRIVGGQSVDIRHFRHELASALGVLTLLKSGHAPKSWADLAPYLQNLALYLIAAHHGKVRLSIRSMPGEKTPDWPDLLFARGVWEGDRLPEVELGKDEDARDVIAPLVERLDLSPMVLGQVSGQPSWVERTVGLRDDREGPNDEQPRFGPLKLAYLEAVLRAADIRASKCADEKATKAEGVQS